MMTSWNIKSKLIYTHTHTHIYIYIYINVYIYIYIYIYNIYKKYIPGIGKTWRQKLIRYNHPWNFSVKASDLFLAEIVRKKRPGNGGHNF